MNINNDIGTQGLASINQKENIQKVKSDTEESTQGVSQTSISTSNEINISFEGKLNQEIDSTSNKIDDILLRHTTSEQKQALDGIYKKLDDILEKDQLTDKEEALADDLFEQVHVILETSIEKLTTSENETVGKLVNKMDILTEQLEKNYSSDSLMVDPSINKADVMASLSNATGTEIPASKKSLTVAQINALSVAELNTLPAHQLKKLNAQKLNRLNSSQLNRLDPAQVKQLTPNNVDKVNQS